MKKLKPGKVAQQLGILTGLTLSFLLLSLLSGCAVSVYDGPETLIPGEHGARTYYMRQRVWALGEQFEILDGRGQPIFFVKGKIFTIGDRLGFFDRHGNRLAYIKQVVLSLTSRYTIFRNRQPFAQVVKKFTVFKDRFIIKIPTGDDYEVRGDFGDYHYTFYRRGRPVAEISKRWLSFADQYRIDIVAGEDDIIILAAAVIVDMVSHDEEHHHHKP